MGESTNAKVTGLIPMAHVADVQRSVEFYKMLGMELRASLKGSTNGLQWAHLACEGAHLMFARASETFRTDITTLCGQVLPTKMPTGRKLSSHCRGRPMMPSRCSSAVSNKVQPLRQAGL